MKAGSITTLFVSALLVGWLAPGLKTHDATQGADAAAPSELSEQSGADERLAVNRSEQWLDGQGVLRRQNDGHFYTDASVDGARVRLLVDTGASMVALTGEDAEAIGLSWDEADLRPIGRGASGPVNGVSVRLERIEVAGIEAQNVDAAIIPEGLDVSLLGQSFLSKLHNVSISGDEMRLGG
ncbi:MAG: TIGR02281 family clan AA aspartic protease [Novosphingobium sp.]|nr:TIGR02281 family clan AA aspartic protease [Novosphingobium sp.]